MSNEIKKSRGELLVEKYNEFIEDKKFPEISSPTKKQHIAMLLENYNNFLLEKTETGDIEKYDPVMLSVIRRGYPNLIGMEIYGTQPMSGPSGLIFGMRSVFHNSTAYPIKRAASVVLVLADATGFPDTTVIANAAGATGVVRYKEGNTILVQVTSTGTWPTTCFTAGESVDDADPYAAAVTTITSVFDNELAYQFLFKDYAKFSSVAVAEAATTTIKEVGFDIFKATVTAENFKLKAKYSDELQQDMKAQQNLDADTELTRIMSNEITAEMNKKFIDKWNEKAALGGTTSWTYATSGTPGRWEMERTYELYGNINKVANQIAKSTLRGRGNIIIASMDVVSKFETMRHWFAAPGVSSGLTDVNLGASAFVGTLGNKYKVYCDMYAAADYCSIGYKGGEWDTGLYYCPYVPIYVKKGIGEEDGQNRIWFHTRYGLGENPFGAHLYYRYININL